MNGGIAYGRADAEARLVDADARLAALQLGAGGQLGGRIAFPSIEALVRLACRLGVPIRRWMRIADGGREIEIEVMLRPDGAAMAIEIIGLDAYLGEPHRAASEAMKPQFPGIVALERIEWTVDGRLALIALAGFPRAAEPQPWAGLIGQPITRLFRMGEGDLPLLDAFARRLAFSDQSACLDDPAGGAWRLAAIPIFDAAADFAGFRGQALPETGASHEANRPAIASSPRPDAVVHVPASGAELGTDVGEALREPLGVIVEQADAIRERRDGPLRRGYADYAADIASAGRHLMSLVEDLVEVQAIEHADFSTARDVVELCELARQAVGLVASRAARKEIAIDILCDEGNVQACGEARRILQILVNLLGNAVRHSPGGGRIEVAIALGDGEARIEVADQGPGIAAEDQARIFDKFERIDRSDPNGSGLGLYISRRLARAMGGRLEVESVPGEGARFRLALPRP